MLKRPTRILAALSFAAIALGPLAAHAQFSGTNGQIFFGYEINSTFSIAAANSDGSESHIVVQGTSSDTPVLYNVSADGTKIVYLDETSSGDENLIVANSDGTSPVTVATSLAAANADFTSATFGPSAATVYYAMRDIGTLSPDPGGLYSVAATGGSSTHILAIAGSAGDVNTVLYNSANNKLYYEQTVQGTPNSYLINDVGNTGTGNATLHTFNASTDAINLMDITPDGSTLLISNRDSGGTLFQLFSEDTATGNTITQLTTLSNSNNVEHSSYSPDGTKLIYASENYTGGVNENGAYVVNANGSGTPALFRADAQDPYFSATTTAAPGTYPDPLVLGDTSSNGNGGNSGGSPSLPDAGSLGTSLPVALGLLGLVAAGGIETVRRVRRRV